MLIPVKELDKDTLHNLVESFVLREGTEYGEVDVPVDQKIAQVIKQLQNDEAVILYSELHETVNIISQQEFKALTRENPNLEE